MTKDYVGHCLQYSRDPRYVYIMADTKAHKAPPRFTNRRRSICCMKKLEKNGSGFGCDVFFILSILVLYRWLLVRITRLLLRILTKPRRLAPVVYMNMFCFWFSLARYQTTQSSQPTQQPGEARVAQGKSIEMPFKGLESDDLCIYKVN